MFVRADGTEVTDSRIEAIAATADARRAKAGLTTIKRTLVTESILREADRVGGGSIRDVMDLFGDVPQGVSSSGLPAAIRGTSYTRSNHGNLGLPGASNPTTVAALQQAIQGLVGTGRVYKALAPVLSDSDAALGCNLVDATAVL